MSITLKDIAQELGVSASTISKAINDRPGVSGEMRQKILQAIEEKNFRPKYRGGGLSKDKTTNINLLVRINQSVEADPFYSLITEGISTELQNQRCNLLYYVMNERHLEETVFEEIFETNHVSGTIFVGADFDNALFEKVALLDVPVVTVDNQYRGFGSVNTDNYTGALEAMNHLVELGHEQIIFLSGPLKHKSIKQRHNGYEDIMKKRFPASRPLVIECDGVSVNDGYEAIRSCGNIDFTAVFAATDKLAIGGIKALKERGYRIPQDISFVGFDDIEWGLHTEPPLTTIRTAKHQMGALAAQLLTHLINSKEEAHIADIMVSAKLVPRASSIPIAEK